MFRSLCRLNTTFRGVNRFSYSHSALSKVVNSLDEALEGVQSGHKILVGGFGLGGIPENLIRHLSKSKTINDLTLVTCTCAIPSHGSGVFITNNMVKRVQTCYTGEHPVLEKKYINGEIAMEFMPQGSLVEKIRAGAMGIPAFYTPAGVGTYVETGGFPVKFKQGSKEVEEYSKPKEKRVFNGSEFLMEEAIKGDFSLIKAWKADTEGNLIMRKTSKNFNQDMAGAAKITVAEVEEIVPAGQLDGTDIHVPGIFVDRVVLGPKYEKIIGRIFYQTDKGIVLKGTDLPVKQKHPEEQKIREKIARRAAQEIQNGMYVNLGIGIPTIVRSFLRPDIKIVLQGENGILGIGPYPQVNQEDADLINAGNESVSAVEGASFFCSTTSFGMYRGRHMSATILGGMQVSRKGDIANWVVPNKLIKGMGGAMDLVSSGAKVICCMEHNNKKGQPKILERCTLPLTGVGVVDMLITDMAVFSFENGQMTLREVASDHSLEEVIEKTGCEFIIPDKIGAF